MRQLYRQAGVAEASQTTGGQRGLKQESCAHQLTKGDRGVSKERGQRGLKLQPCAHQLTKVSETIG